MVLVIRLGDASTEMDSGSLQLLEGADVGFDTFYLPLSTIDVLTRADSIRNSLVVSQVGSRQIQARLMHCRLVCGPTSISFKFSKNHLNASLFSHLLKMV